MVKEWARGDAQAIDSPHAISSKSLLRLLQEEPKFERWKNELERSMNNLKTANRQVFNEVECKPTGLVDAFEDLGAQLRVSSQCPWIITSRPCYPCMKFNLNRAQSNYCLTLESIFGMRSIRQRASQQAWWALLRILGPSSGYAGSSIARWFHGRAVTSAFNLLYHR